MKVCVSYIKETLFFQFHFFFFFFFSLFLQKCLCLIVLKNKRLALLIVSSIWTGVGSCTLADLVIQAPLRLANKQVVKLAIWQPLPVSKNTSEKPKQPYSRQRNSSKWPQFQQPNSRQSWRRMPKSFSYLGAVYQ